MSWLLVAVGNHAVEKVSNFRQKLNVDGASLAMHENGQSSPSQEGGIMKSDKRTFSTWRHAITCILNLPAKENAMSLWALSHKKSTEISNQKNTKLPNMPIVRAF